jgi:shikimate kinase
MSQRLIVITGFMGSGKTTVAHALANILGCDAKDLDESLTWSEKRDPKEIIDEDGEDRFREIETNVLAELLADSVGVLSLGGGTWTIPENRKLLAEHDAITIWLDAPFELCWNRIEAAGNMRPLASSYDAARKRYQERAEIYALADHRIGIDAGNSAEEIANTIAVLISPHQSNS